jgi:DNA polymerase-3 subunit delta
VIALLHGADTYRVRAALAAIRAPLETPDGMLESNTALLEATVTAQELLANATAVPFLAPARLVIVQGLIAGLAKDRGGRPRKSPGRDDVLEQWRSLCEQLADAATLPPTTTLVFVEGAVRTDSAAFKLFAGVAQVSAFPLLSPDGVYEFASERAAASGAKFTDGAIRALAEATGPDLWALSNEMEKLVSYGAAETVEADTMRRLVGSASETKIWEVTDAIVAGDDRKATGALARLLADGEPPPVIAAVITSQFRRISIVKDMTERRVPRRDIAKAIDPGKAREFMVDRAQRLAREYSWAMLREAYRKMLDADLAVKRGEQDDESALELLVHELCALAPAAASRRPAYAR